MSVHCQKFHEDRDLGPEQRLAFHKCLTNIYQMIQ